MPLPLIDLLWRDHPDAPAGRAARPPGPRHDRRGGRRGHPPGRRRRAGRGDRPSPGRRARRLDDVGLHARQQPRRPAGPDGRRGAPAGWIAAPYGRAGWRVPGAPGGRRQPGAAPAAPVAARRRRRPHRARARHDRQVRPRARRRWRRSGSTTPPGTPRSPSCWTSCGPAPAHSGPSRGPTRWRSTGPSGAPGSPPTWARTTPSPSGWVARPARPWAAPAARRSPGTSASLASSTASTPCHPAVAVRPCPEGTFGTGGPRPALTGWTRRPTRCRRRAWRAR